MISVRKRVMSLGLRLYGRAEECLYRTGVVSPDASCVPHFLGIGAQKSGTTWLAKNLGCHPDVYLPEAKELHYFNQRRRRRLKAYLRNFCGNESKTRGEFTPAYAILDKRAIRFVRALNPRMKLIFLMRNPIERAWSQAVMDLAAVKNRKLVDVPDNEFIRHFHSTGARLRGDYLRCLDNWREAFPEEQILTGFFEDISSRPKELLTRVFRHIGVSVPNEWSEFPFDKVIFAKKESEPIRPDFHEELSRLYKEQIDRIAEKFGGPSIEWKIGGSSAP